MQPFPSWIFHFLQVVHIHWLVASSSIFKASSICSSLSHVISPPLLQPNLPLLLLLSPSSELLIFGWINLFEKLDQSWTWRVWPDSWRSSPQHPWRHRPFPGGPRCQGWRNGHKSQETALTLGGRLSEHATQWLEWSQHFL